MEKNSSTDKPANFSIFGLGKLGASMAAAIASRGLNVVGVDVNAASVDRLNAGLAPIEETNLQATIAANRPRLRATMDAADAVANSDVSFVVVPTPSDERGAFSLEYAKAAFTEVGRGLSTKQGYHLVVMSSTVLPGATRYGLIPLLEGASGKRCGEDFGVCYSPEFIALGSVIRDFLNPDFTLVGEYDDRSGAMLECAYAAIMQNQPPCRRMTLENAELTKIAVNTFVTMKITYANMISALCELLPGGDVDVVTRALGSDKRIGGHYLKGGLGYGGPCFPRDNQALAFIARELGATAALAETTDRQNRAHTERVALQIDGWREGNDRIAILGLAYKPFSHVVEESPGVALANELARAGCRVTAYDPLAQASARTALDKRVTVVASAAQAIADADVVVITTPDPEFVGLRPEAFRRPGSLRTVVDFWRILKAPLTDADGIRYIAGGCSLDDDAAESRLRELWADAATVGGSQACG